MDSSEKQYELINRLKSLGISHNVLEAMNKINRHDFVLPEDKDKAYYDTALSIGCGQTISAPHMVAIMCDLLELKEGDKVLEIGTGSGYNAAVISELVGYHGHVYTIERIKALMHFAKSNLDKANYSNITLLHKDGSCGEPAYAPYDKICVTSAAPKIPEIILGQLSNNGILVIPVGNNTQHLFVVKKDDKGKIFKERKESVLFVPLIGKYGFEDFNQKN